MFPCPLPLTHASTFRTKDWGRAKDEKSSRFLTAPLCRFGSGSHAVLCPHTHVCEPSSSNCSLNTSCKDPLLTTGENARLSFPRGTWVLQASSLPLDFLVGSVLYYYFVMQILLVYYWHYFPPPQCFGPRFSFLRLEITKENINKICLQTRTIFFRSELPQPHSYFLQPYFL